MAQNGQQMSPAQANLMARQMVTGGAVKRTQSIYSRTIDTSQQTKIEVEPRLAGLILGFIVNVRTTFDVAASTGTALTKTPMGAANLVENFTLFDLNNQTRINTPGWHIALLNSARASRPYLGVDAFDNYPIDFGDYYTELNANAASIAQDASGAANFTYFVPLAYSDLDLRGAIYAGVVNATMSLQIQLNRDMVQARTVQGWQSAVYCTTNASTPPADVTENNVEVEVLQVYYDQIPRGQNGGPILPLEDLAVSYELKQTALSGITANQDFPIPYSNFRDFLSTVVLYRNSVETNGFAAPGDITDWKLEAANFTNIFEFRERYAAANNRQIFGQDLPTGTFLFSSRQKPISTVQYGNMNLVLDANQVDAGATLLVGFEAFAFNNVIGQAGSLTPGA